MDGSDRERFCVSCEKSVYDISQMAPCEAEKLFVEHEARGERPCIRLVRRVDGSIVFGLAASTMLALSACGVHKPAPVDLATPTGMVTFSARYSGAPGDLHGNALPGWPGICFLILPPVPSPEGAVFASPITAMYSDVAGRSNPVLLAPASYRWWAGHEGWSANGTLTVESGDAQQVEVLLNPPDEVNAEMGDWDYVDPCATPSTK